MAIPKSAQKWSGTGRASNADKQPTGRGKDVMSEAEIKYWEGEITNAEIHQLADAGDFYLEVDQIL